MPQRLQKKVGYAENNQPLQKLENADVIVVKGLQSTYSTPTLQNEVLKRKSKSTVMA